MLCRTWNTTYHDTENMKYKVSWYAEHAMQNMDYKVSCYAEHRIQSISLCRTWNTKYLKSKGSYTRAVPYRQSLHLRWSCCSTWWAPQGYSCTQSQSCHAISLAGAATNIICCNKHMFFMTRHIICCNKSMLAATKLCLSWQSIFVTTNTCLSQQACFCSNKRHVLLRHTYLSWQK